MPQMAGFFHIRTKEEGIIPLTPRPVQRHFHQNRGRRTVMPKYRQGGLSTWLENEGLLLMLDPELAGLSGVIISHEKTATERLLSIVELAYERMPERDHFPMRRESKSEFLADNGSRLYIGTAGSRAFGRGDTVHWAHCCLGGSTIVIGADGRVGGMRSPPPIVRTHLGRRASVLACAERSGGPQPTISIKPWGLRDFPIEATADHQVFTRRGWVPAGELTNEDYVAIPLRNRTSKLFSWPLPPRRDKRSLTVPLDSGMGYLCGMYLAEGLVKRRHDGQPGAVQFCLDTDEVFTAETLAPVAARIVRAAEPFIHSWKVARRHASRSTVLTLYGSRFAELILSKLGTAEGKYLPDSLWGTRRDFLDGLIQGYVEGDGHINPRQESISVSSTRPHLITQMRDLLITLRYGYSSIARQPAGRRWGRNCQEQWILRIMGVTSQRLRARFGWPPIPRLHQPRGKWDGRSGRRWLPGRKHYWVKIAEIASGPVQRVYDLVLAHQDHSFLTVGGAVHNSEVAHWDDAERIMLGLGQAVPERGYITVESSPFGRTGWFFEAYDKARRGVGSYRPLFLPWFWSREEYRDQSDELELTTEEANVMEAAARMGLPLDHGNIAWRRRQIADLGPSHFAQEYPEDDESCFLVSGRPYFEPAFIQMLIKEAEARPVLETRHIPGAEVRVWEKAGVGHSYVIGIDPSEGKKHGDACAAIVENCDTGQHAASLYGRITPYALAQVCVNLAKEYNDALLAPEGGTASGQSLITFLTETLKANNIYRNERHTQWHSDGDVLGYELGFRTTARSKRYLCDEFDRAIRCGDFRSWDTRLLGQVFDVLVDDLGQVKTASDREDDLLMAAMIANVAAEQATRRSDGVAVGSYL